MFLLFFVCVLRLSLLFGFRVRNLNMISMCHRVSVFIKYIKCLRCANIECDPARKCMLVTIPCRFFFHSSTLFSRKIDNEWHRQQCMHTTTTTTKKAELSSISEIKKPSSCTFEAGGLNSSHRPYLS